MSPGVVDVVSCPRCKGGTAEPRITASIHPSGRICVHCGSHMSIAPEVVCFWCRGAKVVAPQYAEGWYDLLRQHEAELPR